MRTDAWTISSNGGSDATVGDYAKAVIGAAGGVRAIHGQSREAVHGLLKQISDADQSREVDADLGCRFDGEELEGWRLVKNDGEDMLIHEAYSTTTTITSIS